MVANTIANERGVREVAYNLYPHTLGDKCNHCYFSRNLRLKWPQKTGAVLSAFTTNHIIADRG